MKRQSLFIISIIAAFILAWYGGYRLYGAQDANQSQTRSDSSEQIDVRAASNDTDLRVEATNDDSDTDTDNGTAVSDAVEATTEARSPASEVLEFQGWETDTDSSTPKVCLSFSEALDSKDNVKIRDYITIDPKTQLSTDIIGRQLCLGGLAFDKEYEITLREGLPGAKGRKLDQDASAMVAFGDKPAFVGFAGEGIILPRINSQGLAIETINVDVLSIEIAKVSDRMMARRNAQSGEATMEGDWSYEYSNAATDIREVIWDGEIDVKTKRNAKVTTVVPLTELLGELTPGAYVVSAVRKHEDEESRPARAWRWIISTDLAMTSYRGTDGLTVSVRSIDTAKLQTGVKVSLVAQNNAILGEATTDATGRASFAAPLLKGEGPKRAKMVMAYGAKGDYAMLDLSRAPLDLSEFSIGGRNTSGPVDVYGFAERGVYRPGETAHLTVMLRDPQAMAVTDNPATLIVRKPNGVEMLSQRFEADAIQKTAGTIVMSYDIPRSAPRGMWSVAVKVDGLGQVGSVSFDVEDFVPQKLRLGIETAETPIRPGEIRDVTIDAQFLYGAPGAALESEAEARIRIDPNPFKAYSKYQFGPADQSFEERYIELGSGVTDGSGRLTLGLDMKRENLTSAYPLRAEITVGTAEPGGRYVRDSVRIPVRTQDAYLGVKPNFNGSRAPKGKPAELSIIAVDFKGEPVATDVTWSLVEEDWSYHWYRERGRWRYRRDVRDVPMLSGKLSTTADGPAAWSKRLNYGDYRLDITTADGTKAGYRFAVGWGQASRSDTPDQIRMGAPEGLQKAGDAFKLSINAPYAGLGELVIANDEVRLVKSVKLPEGGSEISIPFEKEWGDSVYAMLTLYTPRDAVGRPVPRRAVGVSYVALDRHEQTLGVSIQAPEVIRPRTEQVFTVDVRNAKRNETVWMNFAAVDEGILQLTKYKSPSADGFFFGKKALNVDIRDDYARILNPNLGEPAIAKAGGDDLGGEGLTVVPTKTVAMFEGPLQVKNGKATIVLDIPDFNGEIRLMTTAWTARSVGSASKPVTVRDKVPAIVGLPRFLAPGDKAFATVSLQNVEGPVGNYSVDLKGNGTVSSEGGADFALAKGERREGKISLSAANTGISSLDLGVKGPENYSVASNYDIQVRTPYFPITTAKTTKLSSGESLSVSTDLIDGIYTNSADVTVSFSRLGGIDPAPYVSSLAKYPYGCTEQTVSTAMPLLYAESLGGIAGQTEADRREGLQDAITRLASRQGIDGAFGLWSAGDRNATPWLGVYATDFLQRARAEELYVPEDVMNRAYSAMRVITKLSSRPYIDYDYDRFSRRNNSNRQQQIVEPAAYAHYVLAKAGKGNLSEMRYLFDNKRTDMKSPLAYAYLGSALSQMGDKSRAAIAFKEAAKRTGYNSTYDYYQSPLRDIGGVIAATAEAKSDDVSVELVDKFSDELKDEKYLNTQQKAYAVLAMKTLLDLSDTASINAENAVLGGSEKRPAAYLYGPDLAKSPSFTNTGNKPIWATVTVSGAPKVAPKPMAEGFKLSKTVFTLDGKAFDGAKVKQGERYVVKLQFNSTARHDRTFVIADLLPAGFEIETVLTSSNGKNSDGSNGGFAWIGNINDFDITEARDDRFIVSSDTYERDRYIAAYIVRAVTPGEFVLPGAILEDMYRPEDRAITSYGTVTISADPTL